jgi:hypothetical protein
VRTGLDEVDHAKREDRPVPELEHVSDLDRRRDVGDAEVVARATVDPDFDPTTSEA